MVELFSGSWIWLINLFIDFIDYSLQIIGFDFTMKLNQDSVYNID